MIRTASGRHDAGRSGAGRLFAAATLAAALVLGMLMVPGAGASKAFAASGAGEPYTYSVTLYAGNGTIGGGDSITVDGLQYGSRISLVLDNGNDEGTATVSVGGASYTVVPDDERYYPKGIRLAGDNEQNIARPEFEVTQNEQYVVAYGLKQERVTYRVEYVDVAGATLAESQSFYGNVGDKPVAAARYIEGYTPNAYNITGTLSANEADNVFRFVYSPAAASTTQVVYVNRGFPLATGPAVALQGAATEGAGAGAGAAAGDAGAAGDAATEPVELIDLDDDETPLASGAMGGLASGTESAGAPSFPVAMVAALGGLAALFVILAVFMRRLMRKDEN